MSAPATGTIVQTLVIGATDAVYATAASNFQTAFDAITIQAGTPKTVLQMGSSFYFDSNTNAGVYGFYAMIQYCAP